MTVNTGITNILPPNREICSNGNNTFTIGIYGPSRHTWGGCFPIHQVISHKTPAQQVGRRFVLDRSPTSHSMNCEILGTFYLERVCPGSLVCNLQR